MLDSNSRAAILRSFDATDSDIEELLRYNENRFVPPSGAELAFPLPDEPFVAAWQAYLEAVPAEGAFAVLRERLPQLNFPVQRGISQQDDYRAATRKGAAVPAIEAAAGLRLVAPERIELTLQPTPAGRIPVIVCGRREDFVSLMQALTCRNEPEPIPASMGACIVAGYNNWDRVRRYRDAWSRARPVPPSEEDWQAEFQRLVPRKELYQDRFILLSGGPYSGVPAHAMGLDEAEWKRLSLIIRREHECAHYFTRRLFQSMRNNLLDELIADFSGMIAAIGAFRADWFLRFCGLENYPEYRAGGRLENYRGAPPLSDAAFRILQTLVKRAAENVEAFSLRNRNRFEDLAALPRFLTAMSTCTLEELVGGHFPGD